MSEGVSRETSALIASLRALAYGLGLLAGSEDDLEPLHHALAEVASALAQPEDDTVTQAAATPPDQEGKP